MIAEFPNVTIRQTNGQSRVPEKEELMKIDYHLNILS